MEVYPMSDWRKAHRKELLEKQRHIGQKLAQLREFRALVLKWRRLMKNYSDWFGGLKEGVKSSKWFSVESMVRMGSIMVQLNQLVGEFEQVGDPKTMGTGSKSTGMSKEQQQAAAAVELINAKAGPLANSAPWELVWHIDPETSESVRQGDYGAAIVNITLNPITTLSGYGFAKEIAKQSVELIKENPEEFKALEKGWNDTQKALKSISSDLDNIDLNHLDQLTEGLEDVLKKYESAYDGARGDDNTSARLLRKTTTGK
jgi:hypothetical protein